MGNTRHRIENVSVSVFESARLLYVSTSKYEGDWQSILHAHPFSELFYVVSGSGVFVTEEIEFPVGKNDMVIINPNVQHTEKSESASPLEYIVLGIDGLSFSFDKLTSAQDGISMHVASGTVYKYNMQNSYIYAYLNIMLEEITHRDSNYEIVCQNLLEVLLTCMLRNDNLSIVQNKSTILSRECAQIKTYLDSNYSENITLDTLADSTHMNKYYMVHAFTKYTGISPINYLIQKRIQEGKSLLESANYSISQISATLGFSSQSYFSQAFKRATGKTPIQYRNEYRKQKQEQS